MVLTKEILRQNKKFLAECGGKARNLFLLSEMGLKVPNFIILPASTLDKILEGIKPKILSVLQSNQETIQIAEKLEILLADLKIKEEILQSIISSIRKELPTTKYFAVRSSVTMEDSSKASFAGLFNTSLNVEIEHIEAAILQGIRSLYQLPVLEYSRLKNIDPSKNRLALVIQKMLDASVSGIIFTMNPSGNFNDLLISCAKGLGEGVVNNTSEITNYLISRQNNLSFKEEKEVEILTENQRKELVQRALEIEKKMGLPQDIEFSFDQDGKLFILQSRPITTIDLKNLKIVDNTNIVESYPGITMPLTFSFARNGYQQVFTSAARLFKVPEKQISSINSELSSMITHVNGRIYYNLHNWYKLMQIVISSQNSLQAWETLIGVKMKSQNVSPFSFLKKIRTGFISLGLFFRYRKIVRGFYQNFEKEYSALRFYADSLSHNKPKAKEVFSFYKDLSDRLFTYWAPTLLNDFFTFKFFDLLKKMTFKIGFSEDETITNDLLCGMPGVESEMLVVELLKLKENILKDENLKLLFAKSNEEILDQMPENFRTKLDDFVAKYGDRTLEELKLETPNFRMKPTALMDLLKSQLENKNTPESLLAQQNTIRDTAEKRIKEKLSFFAFKRIIFLFILNRTREAIRNRENMRLRRTRSYGAVKELFVYIAREMKMKGFIEKVEDVFYLNVQQLEEYCLQGKAENLKEYIAKKKFEFAEYEHQNLPDRMVFNGDFPPVKSRKFSFDSKDKILYGTSISKGHLSGETIVLTKPDYTQSVDGKILVTRMTDPAWVFLMTRAAGLISEKGSPLSHTAIVGRELGIPVIIGIENATLHLPTGTKVNMNCDEGFVEVLEEL